MSRVVFGPLPIGAPSGYDAQLSRWLSDQFTTLSRLLTRATDVTDQFSSGTLIGLTLGANNTGASIPALEVTRSTDTAGYSTIELSNAAGARQLELVSCGSVGAYGIPANQTGINAVTALTISTADTARVSIAASAVAVTPALTTANNIYTGDDRGVYFTATVGDFSVGVFGISGEIRLTAGSATRMRVKSTGQVRFVPLAADPAGLEDGDVWYNSTAGKLRVRAGGVTIDLH